MIGKNYVIGSQKGGGRGRKTTSTLNLAYALQKQGEKVLTVDFDSQANLTACYGIENTGELEHTIGHLMMAAIEDEKLPAMKRCVRTKDSVDFIPSSIYLSVADAKLRLEMGAEKILSEILEPLRGKYDYILIDTCPSLGMLTINALAAAGILMTMCEARTNLCRTLTEQVEESFQGQIRIFDTRIPHTVKVGESIYYSMPVEQYSSKASAGIAYRKFAEELISIEG